MRLSAEKGRLDRTLTGAELELAEAQRQIQLLEVPPLPTQPWTPSLPSSGPHPHPQPECQVVPRVTDSLASPVPSTSQPMSRDAGGVSPKIPEGGPPQSGAKRNANSQLACEPVCAHMLWTWRGMSTYRCV